MRKGIKILLAVIAVCGVLLVAGVVGGVLFIRSHLDREVTDPQAARSAMDAARQRFGGAKPIIALDNDGPLLNRPVPARPAAARLQTVHIIQWDPDDAALVRADLPFALLRIKDGPIRIGASMAHGFRVERAFQLTGEQIERFGPALLFDQDMPDGSHFVIWTE
jgi:hypothetical protein